MVSAVLGRPSLRAALAASSACALAALAGAAVRVLPWLLDPAVSWRVAAPFARSIAALALEASLLVGWPIGWALSAVQLVERGEGRALQALGERPARTLARLFPQAVAWGVALACVSFVGGRDASAPGRVVNELLDEARTSCEQIAREPGSEPATRAVPFVDATWLCAPSEVPRLAGHGPGRLRSVTFTATGARVTGDLRGLELEGAKLALGTVRLAVSTLAVKGLVPWAHASSLAPLARAALLALTGASSALLAAYSALRGWTRTRFAAVIVGAAGPVAALLALRAFERGEAAPAWCLSLVPLAMAAMAATIGSAVLLSGLPRRSPTASK
jgi:hypothetical protein